MAWLGLVAGRRLPLPTPQPNLFRSLPHPWAQTRRRAWAWWTGGVVTWVMLALFALPVLAAALLAGGLLLALTVLLRAGTNSGPSPSNRLGPVRHMRPPPPPAPPCRIPADPPCRRVPLN